MTTVLLNNTTKITTPTIQQFELWVNTVIKSHGSFFQVSIEIVDEATSKELNKTYRNKNKPTNILSFPLELPDFVTEDLIGDLAICASIVVQEATQQNKDIIHHWAHLTIHGTLHLLNYDHINDGDATIMENIEIKLLAQLGIGNPYD
ncbi:MAG: rRNA maturation RNase YbeY [Proteobacteria bacterium]|nr:rRNA maturation RNase YbeY [Pseudomonadota bacterium]